MERVYTLKLNYSKRILRYYLIKFVVKFVPVWTGIYTLREIQMSIKNVSAMTFIFLMNYFHIDRCRFILSWSESMGFDFHSVERYVSYRRF